LIANLVENAIRYTPKTGRIDVTVSGSGVQQPGVAVRSRNARGTSASTDMAILTVADTGIGISPADLPHVFERFYRADKARSRAHGGTGLGLSIAQYIAQAHGGSIQAASEGANRGSTFSLRLPLMPEATRRAPASTARESPRVPIRR
jgi:two-component system sensor histidine kinase BaeS